jgi:predicted TIM-barrel fold metal-dependent hydrolase
VEGEGAGPIDVHHHILPPGYLAAIREAGLDRSLGIRFPSWRPEASLDFMDGHAIAAAVVSISTPGVAFAGSTGPAGAARLARQANEWAAGLVRDHPGRFGALATVPLPDVDAALAETAHTLDVLGLDGVVLLASAGGRYLGDRAFEPLMAELHRRRAVVFLHPTTPPEAPRAGLAIPVFAVEFMADTTRAIANLILSGTLERHPGISFICAHAGGFAPYITDRLQAAWDGDAAARERAPAHPLAYLQQLHYDTAASVNPFTLPAVAALAGPGRLLLGTDFPFASEREAAATVERLATIPGLTAGDRRRIERDNAAALFPRLA